MARKTQASVGHRQVPVRKCKAAQRDREASLDRCAARMRAGDESEEAKQGRQRLRPPRELVWRYLPGIRSAQHPGRDAPPRAESPGAFPGSVPDQTRLQSEVDATLIRIRRASTQHGRYRSRALFPAFLPNWCSARSVIMVTEPRQRSNTTLVCELVAGNREFNRELTGHEHRTLEFENRSLDNYCPDRDDLFIASNAASASSGRARTTKSSVRFTQRTLPAGSIRNSAGREMSAPSRRPCGCTRSHLRITSSCASERIGNV